MSGANLLIKWRYKKIQPPWEAGFKLVYLIIASRRRLRKRAGFHLGFLGLL
jgi:hypothetical protein